jgi:hypothetical protein
MTDPITKLHYAANANIVNGTYAPGADGFNLADVSSKGTADALPAGVEGLVWMGNTIAGATAAFQAEINSMIGDSKIYGFYLAVIAAMQLQPARLPCEPASIAFSTARQASSLSTACWHG